MISPLADDRHVTRTFFCSVPATSNATLRWTVDRPPGHLTPYSFCEAFGASFFLDGTYGAGGQRDGRRHTKWIACEAKLAKEITHPRDGGDCRWLLFRPDTEPYPSFLNVKERVGWRALLIDGLFVTVAPDLAAQTGS